MDKYNLLITRNKDYVAPSVQDKIRTSRLLIAGCGIGSSLAEAAVRLGFEHFILADGDVVDAHNLNRQFYVASDIGRPKVEALANRLRAINPQAKIEEFNDYLNPNNIQGLIERADIVFDTIDFLDLAGIVALHDEAMTQKKHLITALAIGWGGGCIYFPPGSAVTFRDIFSLPKAGGVENAGYTATFARVIERLNEKIAPEVVAAVAKALTIMEDGKPCPASQVAPGAFSVGALAATLLVRILAGQPVAPAPMLLIADMPTALTSGGIDLLRT